MFLTVAASTTAEGGTSAPKTREKKAVGTDLVIRDLYTSNQTTIAEVSDYAVSKNGAWLVYAVSSKTPANDGAFARGLANGVTRTLLSGQGNYKGFVLDTAVTRPVGESYSVQDSQRDTAVAELLKQIGAPAKSTAGSRA